MATLSSLVAETTTIKNTLTTCHTKLKTNLTNKGVTVSSSDKLSTLVDKVANIESKSTKYTVKIKVYTQTSQPSSPKKGDIWLKLSKTLNPVFASVRPSTAKTNDLWIKVENGFCQETIDSSVNSYLSGINKSFTINLNTGQSGSLTPKSVLFLSNSINSIYASLSAAQIYNGSTWVEEESAKYWNGSSWETINPPAKLYAIQDGVINTSVFGSPHSNVSNAISSGATVSSTRVTKISLNDNAGWGKIHFTLGKKVDLSKYSSFTITFAHNTSDTGCIYTYQSNTHFGAYSAPYDEDTVLNWDDYTSTTYRTVTSSVTNKSGEFYFGLYLYTYNPSYIYIKEAYFTKGTSTYSELFGLDKIELTSEEIEEQQKIIEESNKLKREYFATFGLNEEEIDEVMELKLNKEDFVALYKKNKREDKREDKSTKEE